MKYPQLVSMPSVVSDWLEEQLEARGIDAVVYTRYILSLLHTHTIDVIYPDDDVQLSRLNKEGRRQSGGSGRKRSRGSSFSSTPSTSSDWWRHAHVDAERIKRSAAVECLMSASDQNDEIESLVDELCAILNQAKSPSSSPLLLPSAQGTSDENISPQELAKKYYAAFPPLKSQASEQQAPTAVLVGSKWQNNHLTPVRSEELIKKSHKQFGMKVDGDSAMKARQTKQRFSFLSRNKNLSTPPRKSHNFTHWGLNILNNRKQEAMESDGGVDNLGMRDQYVSDVWVADEETEMNMYEDLPVDLQELLDSPNPKNKTVEIMNVANVKNNTKSCFIPYGANIISSIWSNELETIDDNDINEAMDSESSLDFKFSSISINSKKLKTSTDWPTFDKSSAISDNEKNTLFECISAKKNLWPVNDFRSLQADWKQQAAEIADKEHLDEMMSFLKKSFMKLNHNGECSSFAEVLPRSQSSVKVKTFNPFGRSSSMFAFNSSSGVQFEREKEDLLTSERSHFKPINEKLENRAQKQYEDGATFVISNNLEKVDYKRSESGTMLVETGFGQSKKYLKYKCEDVLDSSSTASEMEFVLKFSICQNDKGCQTEESPEEDKVEVDRTWENPNKKTLDTVYQHLIDNSPFNAVRKLEKLRCTCPTFSSDDSTFCPMHRPQRPDSVLGELLWKYDMKACEKCNNNNNNNNANNITNWNNGNNWSSSIVRPEWDSENLRNNLRNIWNGGEVCQSCLKCEAADIKPVPGTPQSIQNMQLREDISQDGEQLLSDLTNLQKVYMEEMPLVAEMSCDISELLNETPKERKRRHFIMDEPGCWSFASRLEEDCMINMSTLPTLRLSYCN